MSDLLSEEIARATDVIARGTRFVLSCHIHPDGDALGSTLAMAHALRSQGKDVVATFPDPFVIPQSLNSALIGTELLVPSSQVIGETFDVAMTFDCGSQSRLGELYEHLCRAETFINIDHHISNERFGDINVIDVDAASSGSVVLSVTDSCGINLTREMAQCMYVALLTDTGRFQFSSTTSQVFEQAARLAAFDLPIAHLSRVLTEEDNFDFLKMVGRILSEMEYDESSSVVSAIATLALREEYGVAYDETEAVIEFIRRARQSDVACVVKEFESGDYRVSLRSLGAINVCDIASTHGGGGHRFAAGFSSIDNPRDIISSVRDAVKAQRK